MADVDLLPSRGIRTAALVDGSGIATNGSQTVAQLAARGMRSICAVDATGVSVSGATLLQLAQRGIRSFCPVDELGVAQSGATADALRRAGIQPMVLLDNTGTALNGSAKTLTLAQRGLSCFCPLDEAGNATTMGAVILVSNTSVLESATVGTTVGTLSVAGGTGTYTFTMTNTAGGKFTTAGTNGVNLNTAGALDYETATSHTITVSATNGGTPITRTIVIAVLNVVEDTTPDAFTFIDVTGAALSTLTESNAITVSGIDGPATMTITGGEYSVNGGAYASTSTSVVAGAIVKVRGTSSALNSTAVNVTLTIGGVSDTFTITTLSSGGTTLTLAWTSANTVYDPVFTLTFYTAVVGDVLTLQIDDNSDFSSLYASDVNTLDSTEVAAGTITYSGITTLLPGVTYYARVQLNHSGTITYSNTVSQTMFIDSTAPTVVSYSPADNATGVIISAELVATFSETIVMGTGTISLKKTSDNSTIDSWNVATSVGSTAGKVEIIGGNTLHLHLTSNLASTTEYYVVWPAGVVKDLAGNNVAAQSSTTIWSFTTAAAVVGLTFTPKDVTQLWQEAGSSPFTFACDIGTASADRIVVVSVCIDAAGSNATAATVNGTNAPVVASYASVGGMSQTMFATARGAVSGSGTQNVVVTTVHGFPGAIQAMVGIITGSATATFGAAANVPSATSLDPHTITATVPTNGVAVIGMEVDRAFTPVITGATGAGNVRCVGHNLYSAAMGYGSTSTVSFTGASNFQVGLLMATWGP